MNEYKMLYDYHTHTFFSHGKCSPEAVVRRAIERGLSEIAISEHATANMFYGLTPKRFSELHDEITRLDGVYGDKIKVRMGIELNLTGIGTYDLPKDASRFEVRILGYHKGIFPKNSFAISAISEALLKTGSGVHNTEAYIRAVERGEINIIAHPGLYIKLDIDALSKACAEYNVLLEVNNSRPMSADKLELAAKRGASFIIGSDAHDEQSVGNYESALKNILEADVADRVVNLVRI